MKHAPLLFLLAFICLLVACRKNPTENHSQYLRLKQVLEEAKVLYLDGKPEKTVDLLESSLFLKLPPQDADDSISAIAHEAISVYYSSILTINEMARCLHFFDSLSTITPPLFLLKECRYDICAVSSYCNALLGNNQHAEVLLDSFLRMPDPAETPRLIKYNEMAATVCSALRNPSEQIRLLEKAINAYRKDRNFPKIGRLMSWLGVAYRNNNQYEDAMRINNEAIEYYQTHDEDQSTVIAYGELAHIYSVLELYDKALEYNRKAIEVSLRNQRYNLGDIYRKYGQMMEDINQTDSAIYYYKKGRTVSMEMQKLNGVIGSDLALANLYRQIPDSASKALELLQPLLSDTTRMPIWLKENIKSVLGKTLYNNGKISAAISLLESAANGQHQFGQTEEEFNIYVFLMKAYQETGQTNRFMQRYPYYIQLQDSMQKQKNLHSITMANVRFETQQKEQENKLLTTEIALKTSQSRLFVIIDCSLLIIGCVLGGWFWMRQKALKLHLSLKEQEKEAVEKHLREQSKHLKQLISSRQELNNHNEELLRQLSEMQATHENSCNLDQVMTNLQPRLLTKEEEENFRDSFSVLYPTVLHKLRSICPRVTRNDELLCMLIVLKQTNEEISRTLGISRPSVLKNRYRLRSKLDLPEGTNLDTEIIQMLTEAK